MFLGKRRRKACAMLLRQRSCTQPMPAPEINLVMIWDACAGLSISAGTPSVPGFLRRSAAALFRLGPAARPRAAGLMCCLRDAIFTALIRARCRREPLGRLANARQPRF